MSIWPPGTPPQAIFEAMDKYIAEQAKKGTNARSEQLKSNDDVLI